MSHEFESVEADIDGMSAKQKLTLFVGVFLLAALVIFVVQNSESTDVQWLMFDATLPKWLIMAVSAVIGAALTFIGSAIVKRRSR
ncbi:MAG: putative integral membrane protein [Candidatus Poriferisodalaceae bacterium]|jgi:uncharacterized integral membrane protein